LAATNRERELLQRNGRQVMSISVLFTLTILLTNLLPALFPMSRTLVIVMVIGNVVTTLAFVVWIFIAASRMNRQLRELRAETTSGTDENNTVMHRNFQAICRQWRGRVWQSSWKFCGLPLVDIHVSDPRNSNVGAGQQPFLPRRARGWIAMGDEARGVFFALGSRAYGGIAIGGVAVGVIAIGGLAVGGIALGGAALGGIALGGGAAGALALGGLAVGWQAVGGLAVAWDVAVGGLALSQHAAYGGGAMARDLAVGGTAQALHANDDVAKAVLLTHPLKHGMDWYAAHNVLMLVVIMTMAFIPSVLTWPLLYRRARTEELAADEQVSVPSL
jgi:hypothetical protein